MYNNLYQISFNIEGKSAAYVPHPSSLPWPVALLLGCHSRKFMFENPRARDKSKFLKATRLFARRVRWAWVFKNEVSTKFEPPLIKRDIKPYDSTVDPVVEGFVMKSTAKFRT